MSKTRHLWRLLFGLGAILAWAATSRADELPFVPPHYDLTIDFDLDHHFATVHEVVTWLNYHQRPAAELQFNNHANFKLPKDKLGHTAKMLEILRLMPSECIDPEGHACEQPRATLLLPGPGEKGPAVVQPLETHYREDNQTALVVPLPHPVGPGETVVVALDFVMRLPQKQGRWGQWKGVTFLCTWLPVLAFYDDCGWDPTPYIPWHQPFFNEAGVYTAKVTLPWDQKIACTGSIRSIRQKGLGLQEVEIGPVLGRDFAFLCCDRFCEYTGQAGPVKVRCLAFPEHEYYAREMVRIACEALPIYARWFGPYPYPEFTLVESYFGWNGNECAGLVMIDERVFTLPHAAGGFVDNLVSHETCHQWWYNVVGTNGYCETWMDEGLATYFCHRLLDRKCGRNNKLLKFPGGFEWLPNIERETYRFYGLYGTLGRGEACETVKDMPGFDHIINLLSMTYDKGSKVVGMIEDRLGEQAFLDFMHHVYSKYHFRVLRVRQLQCELEEYTGRPWKDFFDTWLFGKGLVDWCVEKVECRPAPCVFNRDHKGAGPDGEPCDVTVLLHQKAEINEETVLGFCLDGGEHYQIRLPIVPGAGHLDLQDPPASIDCLPDNRVRVEVRLPCKPTQIAVDPDQVLVDKDPANNYWKPKVRWRFAPLYTQLEETDLTTAYDRWNVIAGPWVYGAAYDDPWFTRSAMAGLRVGAYRTQHFDGGGYLAYRTDDRDIVAGADALIDHFPWPHTQVGFSVERSLTGYDDGRPNSRGALFERYIFGYGDSLYLPPMHYLELFQAVQEYPLPLPRCPPPGAVPFDHQTLAGLHYHLDWLTPYWDAEGGLKVDATYSEGVPIFGEKESVHEVVGQVSKVRYLPDWTGPLSETRVAVRLYGAAGLPDHGEYFALGGGELFRGFDLKQRQGSAVWVASAEWRVPLARGLTWDFCDHAAGLRNVYAAAFYDVGDAYVNGHSCGDVAHAVGGGLRMDVAWFSLVERTILRIDVAKTVNANSPVQVWFGVQHPF